MDIFSSTHGSLQNARAAAILTVIETQQKTRWRRTRSVFGVAEALAQPPPSIDKYA